MNFSSFHNNWIPKLYHLSGQFSGNFVQRFQEVEEKHLQQMKDFVDAYSRAWENQYALLGQVETFLFSIWEFQSELRMNAVSDFLYNIH